MIVAVAGAPRHEVTVREVTPLTKHAEQRQTASSAPAQASAPRAAFVSGVRKILIVDRSPADCAAVRRLLSQHDNGGWHFAEAVKGEEALAVAALPPSYDCIILNDRLPDMDSAEFLEKLKERLVTTEIVTVVLSSEGDEPLSVRAIKSGAADCLPKAHLNSELLFRAVENAVSRQQLAQTQERLRLAYDSAGIAPWDWNLAANTTSWSPALLLLHGLNPDQAGELSDNWIDRVSPMDRARVQQAVEKWLAHDDTFDDEYRIERPDGALRWLSVKGKVLRAAAGKPVHALGVTMDITDRKEREAQLRLFAAAVDAAPDAVVITKAEPLESPGPPILYVNETFSRMTGYGQDEVIGKVPSFLRGPRSDPQQLEQIRKALRSRSPVKVELLNYRKDGTEFWVDISIVPVAVEGDIQSHWVSVQRDTTERRQLAEEARLREERLALAQSAGNIGMCDWEVLTDTFTCSDEYRSHYGLADVALRSFGAWLKLVHPEDRDQLEQEFRGATPEQAACASDFRALLPDGQIRWLNIKAHFFFDSAGQAVRMIAAQTDISARVEAIENLAKISQNLRRLNDDLHRANDSLQLFADAASHDLQSPANTIGTLAGLLAEVYGGRDAEGDQVIDLIASSAQRLKTLIRDLLAYARASGSEELSLTTAVEALEVAMVDLGPAIQESEAAIIYRDLPPEIQTKLHLRQIFQNLIGNSIKYRRPEEAPRIEVAGRRLDSDWVISVKDNGQGFSPEYAETIFLPFQRLHGREYPGSGIGLATCRKLVECNGGSIRAESKPGEGSTFWFTLPVVQ